jgi:hypothetical protein
MKRNNEATNSSKMILSFLGACRILHAKNHLMPFLGSGDSGIFFGLPGPSFFALGLGMNIFFGLPGFFFFLFGMISLKN